MLKYFDTNKVIVVVVGPGAVGQGASEMAGLKSPKTFRPAISPIPPPPPPTPRLTAPGSPRMIYKKECTRYPL